MTVNYSSDLAFGGFSSVLFSLHIVLVYQGLSADPPPGPTAAAVALTVRAAPRRRRSAVALTVRAAPGPSAGGPGPSAGGPGPSPGGRGGIDGVGI